MSTKISRDKFVCPEWSVLERGFTVFVRDVTSLIKLV